MLGFLRSQGIAGLGRRRGWRVEWESVLTWADTRCSGLCEQDKESELDFLPVISSCWSALSEGARWLNLHFKAITGCCVDKDSRERLQWKWDIREETPQVQTPAVSTRIGELQKCAKFCWVELLREGEGKRRTRLTSHAVSQPEESGGRMIPHARSQGARWLNQAWNQKCDSTHKLCDVNWSVQKF